MIKNKLKLGVLSLLTAAVLDKKYIGSSIIANGEEVELKDTEGKPYDRSYGQTVVSPFDIPQLRKMVPNGINMDLYNYPKKKQKGAEFVPSSPTNNLNLKGYNPEAVSKSLAEQLMQYPTDTLPS